MTQTPPKFQHSNPTTASGDPDSQQSLLHSWLSPLVIILIGLTLYLPGVNWGLPAVSSWSQDSIGGMRTLGAVKTWPDHWQGRYAPFQYLVLQTIYTPLLHHWKSTGDLISDPKTGEEILKPPHDERIGLLHLIAGLVSIFMAVATGFGLWMAAQLFTDDPLSAIIATVAFMIGADFTYFAKLGNVDVPSMCWFAWSVYFYVRALRFGRTQDCALLGIFGSLAISTKDSLAGIYPGMALVLLGTEFVRYRADDTLGSSLLKTIFQVKWLIGIAAFVLPYLWINGIFQNPQAYFDRMNYWLDVTADTIHGRQAKYAGSLELAMATLRYGTSAVGWPMRYAMMAACLFAVLYRRREALIVAIPCLSYYIIVIEQIDFVYARFLFPILLMLCLLVGLAGSTWLRQSHVHRLVRILVIMAVFLPSFSYGFAVNLEMMSDSRYAAEEWFKKNVPPPSSIGATSKPQYLPRLTELGYATYSIPMTRDSFNQPQPEYLVLTSYDYEDYSEEQRASMDELVPGRLGYKLVASFDGKYLPPHRSWLAIAGWGTPNIGKISPRILVFKKI